MRSIPIPAQEAGQLKEFKVEETQEVSEQTLVARIDDSQAKMAKTIAIYKLKAAQEEASNEVSVRYAKKRYEIAVLEYEMNLQANKYHKGTVADLEVRKSEFQVQEQKLAIEEAEHKLAIARATAEEKMAECDAADLEIRRREIRSPCFGRIEKRLLEVGRWVKPGDPVLEILQTDPVWVQGYIDANQLTPADVEGVPVRVVFSVKGRVEVFEGKVISSTSKIDRTGWSQVKAEVRNRKNDGQWILRDGMKPDEMIMELKR